MNDLISAEKLKRKCQKLATEAWKLKIKASAETIMNQFIDLINKADIVDVDVPEWIPCSERMPEPENAMYWVCTDTGCQCSCRWTNHNRFWPSLLTDWHWNPFDTPQHSKVIAWMPLPKPYKGEADG